MTFGLLSSKEKLFVSLSAYAYYPTQFDLGHQNLYPADRHLSPTVLKRQIARPFRHSTIVTIVSLYIYARRS